MKIKCPNCKREFIISNPRKFGGNMSAHNINEWISQNHACPDVSELRFQVEHQYKLYLRRVKLPESEMSPVQAIETKRAFYGAIGQFLMLMRDDLSDFTEDEVVKILENISDQVSAYWSVQE